MSSKVLILLALKILCTWSNWTATTLQ